MKKYLGLIAFLMLFYSQGFCQDFAIEIKLKPQKNRSYEVSEDANIKALVRKHGGVLKQSYPNAKNPELLLYYTLKGSGDKKKVVQDYLMTDNFEDEVFEFERVYPAICSNPIRVNDPKMLDVGNSYPLNLIDAPCAWTITKGSRNILIGIADTEFLTTHEDLKNKIESLNGPTPSIIDHHGSFITGIAAADTDNSLGMASVGYNSRVVAHTVQQTVSSNDLSYYGSDVQAAIWALYQMGVPIINASWSGTGLNVAAAREITENGTTLVIAGGNSTSSTSHSTIADVPGVIVVSSVNSSNMHGPTNHARNQWIDICAPGVQILSTGGNNQGYFPNTGTSVAAPFVSGTIALMLSLNPSLTPANIEAIIKSTTDPIADGSSYTGLLGAGRLNAYKAVQAVSCTIQSIHNRIITTNLDVVNCKVSVQNITIQNNAKTSIFTTMGTTVSGKLEVISGALELK